MLEQKIQLLIDTYNSDVVRLSAVKDRETLSEMLDGSIKWTRAVKKDLANGIKYQFDPNAIEESYYRPFVKRKLYFNRQLNEMLYQVPQLFGPTAAANRAFCFSAEERSEFGVIAFDCVPNKDIFMPSAAQVLALYRYSDGSKVDNITDWSLAQFKKHYKLPSPQPSPASGRGSRKGSGVEKAITKEAIFHYVYAVLHDPIYREKYVLNLKREFPRIPLYGETDATFWQWAAWGEELMALHIGYENVAPAKLNRIDTPDEKSRKNAGIAYAPKAMLKADKEAGRIALDTETTLAGIPAAAWEYKLGNRSALEWILDQYKEKKPKDPTIREKFDTYRFADYKEKVIDLLMRVTTVSVRTQEIVGAMRVWKR